MNKHFIFIHKPWFISSCIFFLGLPEINAQISISSFSPLSGPVGTLVTVTGVGLSNPSSLTIGGTPAIIISYTDTTVVGMAMPSSGTGNVSLTATGGTAISGSNFTVTATPYPSLQQGDKLVGTGAIGTSHQGVSVSISADGNTAIVGAPNDNPYVNELMGDGAAWIYTRSGNAWTQQGAKLAANDATSFPFLGCAVALSADGNTAIVGGSWDNDRTGAAWIYTRSGNTWTQQGSKLVATDASGYTQQGMSVSLSADGNTAIVGGKGDNSYMGAAWIYTRSGNTWTQQSKLTGNDATRNAQQGFSVCLSADGNTALVGGEADNNLMGAAWVYYRSGDTWTQQGSKLVGTGAIPEVNGSYNSVFQGESVALSADGNTAIVGGSYDKPSGAAWVYTRTGNTWTQQGSKLVGTGATPVSYQGNSVTLSADGNTAVVGAYYDDTQIGAAWVYTRSGNSWTQRGSKLLGAGAIGGFHSGQGKSVSISADGTTAIIGGPNDDTYIGAAWVFTSNTTLEVNEDIQAANGLLKIYPNPNNGLFKFYYDIADRENVKSLDLYNCEGNHIMVLSNEIQKSNVKQEYNLQNLANGLYSLVVRTDKGKYVAKFLINR